MDARFTLRNVRRLLAKAWLRFLPIGVGLAVMLGAKSLGEFTGLSALWIFVIGIAIFGVGAPKRYERWANGQFGEAASPEPSMPNGTIRGWQFLWAPIFILFAGATFATFGFGLFPLLDWALNQSGVAATESRALSLHFTSAIGWSFYGVAIRATDIAVAWFEKR